MTNGADSQEKRNGLGDEVEERIEHLKLSETCRTYYDPSEIHDLPEEHKAYLLERHGTLELDPVPGFGDADPFNWTSQKVCENARAFVRATNKKQLESYQSPPCCLSHHDGYFHSRFNTIRIQRHRSGPRTESPNDHISDFALHRNFGHCSTGLATA